jgi:uncharacterized protein YjgD (DUF1641 family)
MNVDDIQEVSIWKAMRELNTPEMKRGLGFIIAFLKNISNQESEIK